MKSFKKENKNSTTQAIIKNTEPIFCDFGKSKTVLPIRYHARGAALIQSGTRFIFAAK